MWVCLLCNDTRGGLQPYLGLGLGLRRAGHDVLVVAPGGYRAVAEATGLPFAALTGDTEAVLRSPGVRAAMERGFLATHRVMVEHVGSMVRDHMREALAACDEVDAVGGGFGGMLVGQSVADRLGVPFVQAHLQPLTTTSAFPGLLSIPGLRSLGPLNRLSHAVSRQAFWLPLRGAVNAARRQVLGLPPLPLRGHVGRPERPGGVVLYGHSPSLLPPPADWPAWAHVTGYWFLDRPAAWSPLGGAGVVPRGRAAAGGRRLRQRGQPRRRGHRPARAGGRPPGRGWCSCRAGAGSGPTSCRPGPTGSTRCRTTGSSRGARRPCTTAGPGTTGAALRAGIPSVVVPFGADQTS